MKNNKPKHTPGPWRIAPTNAEGVAYAIRLDAENEVVWLPRENTAETNEANARLIAAAPEVLEALCSIYCMAGLDELLKTKYSLPTVQLIMKQMRDAIAKAKGE